MCLIKLFSEGISRVAINFHLIEEHIHVWHLTSDNVIYDIGLKVVEVFSVGVGLLYSPLFVDCSSQGSDVFEEVVKIVIVFGNHAPLGITIIVCILHPHVHSLSLFDF